MNWKRRREMTSQMYFEHMISALENGDQALITNIELELVNKVHVISFAVNDVATIPDQYEEYVQMERDAAVLIDGVSVYQWQEVLYGSYGGGGAGWFIEEGSSNLREDVMKALSFFGVQWPTSTVPKPSELKAELENLISEIYLENDMEYEDNSNVDFWVIDNSFVSEPYLGGQQIGEIPDVDLKNKIVVKMTQAQFEQLLSEYEKIYGQYPDT